MEIRKYLGKRGNEKAKLSRFLVFSFVLPKGGYIMGQGICNSGESIGDIKEWNRKQDGSVKRNIILDAAERVFAGKDYHDATLDEIAGVAGISKAALYLYFKNKIDLFLSVVERKLSELNKVVAESTADCIDPVSAIKRLITNELDFFSDNAAFFKAFYAQRSDIQFRAQVGEDEIQERVMPLVLAKVNAIAQVIKRGQENGVFQQSVNEREAAFMFISLIKTGVFLEILEPGHVVLTDKAELVERIFLEGLLTRK